MDLTLLSFFAIFALIIFAFAIFKNSPTLAIAASIILLMVGIIIWTDGIHLVTGKTGSYTFNLTTSNEQITGNVPVTNSIDYTHYKNSYTSGLATILVLLSLSFIYIVIRDVKSSQS
jgi:hypothetical protein